MRMTSLLLIPWVVLVMPGLPAAGEARGKRAPDYAVEVKSILGKHCYACHGAVKQKANLRLDTVASIHRGGDSGPAVVSGKSGESLIVEAVSGQSGWRMPPESEGSPLSSAEIAALTAWIDQGAVAPADDQPQADPRAHWAFRTPRRPEVPTADALGPRAAWVRNPIDAFLAVEHRQRGLTPRPAADPATLIRRVHLDLTGLLPGPDLVRAFEADPSNEAYEAIVDRLLASPQYGERWARHWMDVWRYSDWDGWVNEVRESQPHIWRWRDWIVESLNRDAPYSEMIVAMLAADEAWPGDDDALRATGFLVRNWYKFNRNVWLENTVEHTSKAFLGITINCAKCHDHKYDPITQGEYYAFRAFFEPHSVRTDQVPGQPDTAKAGLVRVFDSEPAAPTYRFERGDDKKPLKDQPIAPGVPRILQLQAELGAIKPVALPPETFYPGLRPFVREEAIAQSQREVLTKRAELIRAERAFAEARGVSAALEAGQALALAKRALRAAEAGQNALEARIAADTARYAAVPRPDAAALGRAAARLERKRDLLQAEEAVLKAEIANALATTTVRKAPHDLDAVKLEAAARTKLATVRKSADIAQGNFRRRRRLCAAHAGVCGHEHRPAAGAGALDHRSPKSPGGPDGDQPDLDAAPGHAAGCHRFRLRTQRCAARVARASRLAGRATARRGLADEADSPAHRHQRPVPDGIHQRRAERPEPRTRPLEYLLLANESQAHGSRGGARQRASGCRQSRLHDGWARPRPGSRAQDPAPQLVFPARQGEAGDVSPAVRLG